MQLTLITLAFPLYLRQFSELPGVIGGGLIEDDSQFLADKVLFLCKDVGLHRRWLAGNVRALVDGA